MKINYPQGINPKNNLPNPNPSFSSSKGLSFEKQINITIENYRADNLALFYKRPTPIQVIKVDNNFKTKIIEAYFSSKSTTDYNGLFRSKYIDFEAKEVITKDSFELNNLKKHQYLHLVKVKKMGGIAFILISFPKKQTVFLVDIDIITKYYSSSNISFDILLKESKTVSSVFRYPIDFLPIIINYYL